MRRFIITSNDWFLAASVYLLLSKSDDDVYFIDVHSSVNSGSIKILLKKVKLIFIFGIIDSFKVILYSFLNKRNIVRRYSSRFITMSKSDFDDSFFFTSNDCLVFVNFPWRFLNKRKLNVLNFHPGKLPDFRGLTPICHEFLNSFSSSPNKISLSGTLHKIDDEFDSGYEVSNFSFPVTPPFKFYDLYLNSYMFGADLIKNYFINSTYNSTPINISEGNYYPEISWSDVFRLKLISLSSYPFVRFFINGGIVGFLSWCIQLFLYYLFTSLDSSFFISYSGALSVYGAFFIALVFNFFSMRFFVFKVNGYRFRFLIATIFMIILVGILTQIFVTYFLKFKLDAFFFNFAYPVAAIFLSPLSFAIKRKFVFVK